MEALEKAADQIPGSSWGSCPCYLPRTPHQSRAREVEHRLEGSNEQSPAPPARLETPAFSSQVNRPFMRAKLSTRPAGSCGRPRAARGTLPRPPPTTAHTQDSLQGLCGQGSLGSQGPLVGLPSLTLQATRGGSGRVPCPGSELTSGGPSPQRWGLSAQTPFFSVHPLP